MNAEHPLGSLQSLRRQVADHILAILRNLQVLRNSMTGIVGRETNNISNGETLVPARRTNRGGSRLAPLIKARHPTPYWTVIGQASCGDSRSSSILA